jgi:2-hydroxy-6-oxonona-2,4-dienedioate hydrolase
VASMDIHGGQVAYDLLGPADGQPIVLTPGGRFSKDVPGLRPLAEALAEGGLRVLLWDRPNCGASDVQFYGRSESHMRADTLAELLTRLDMAPAVIAGGSGGARDSLLTAILHPEVAAKVAAWWIVGGVFSTFNLGGYYILPNINTVRRLGMAGVVSMPQWQEVIEANPRNKDRFLALDPGEFQAIMLRWLNAFVPKPGQTIPGVEDEEFGNITMPTMIIRGGVGDLDHPKRTSMEVHCLIPHSELVEPPWAEDAWERATAAQAQGTGNRFDPWVQAAPLLLDFVGK